MTYQDNYKSMNLEQLYAELKRISEYRYSYVIEDKNDRINLINSEIVLKSR